MEIAEIEDEEESCRAQHIKENPQTIQTITLPSTSHSRTRMRHWKKISRITTDFV